MSTLSAELESEKRGSADLRVVVNTQRTEIDELNSQIEERVEKNAAMLKKVETLARMAAEWQRGRF